MNLSLHKAASISLPKELWQKSCQARCPEFSVIRDKAECLLSPPLLVQSFLGVLSLRALEGELGNLKRMEESRDWGSGSVPEWNPSPLNY